MSLFQLIYKATVEKDLDAAWEIILRFDSLINRESVKPFSNEVDEDLKSEMRIILLRRISSFKINDRIK